jgi:hypothetical protein
MAQPPPTCEEQASSHMVKSLPKTLDITDMDIVYRGQEWKYPEDPSAKSMANMLKWNESLVTWLQPKGGSVEDQIPAINVNGKYRGLSLRMQKSIWKHVRLRQGFVNLETLSHVSTTVVLFICLSISVSLYLLLNLRKL